ncbi:hypothetical protein [Roseiconus lacunae]|uniref:Secreted protein n=1 Tax=Roseiconus lacunae TaxID=2605694 RepID=A0ABT7PT27_9BACT|nr:hypothetical protein [Roseiconus lacunae]MDM4019429.1 hypothetical protein [Roseiconus lacunae]
MAAALCLLSRHARGQESSPKTVTKAVYLHVYSHHHLPEHDPESKEVREPTFEAPIHTRVLTMLLTPDVEHFVRCPNARNPDIAVFGRLSSKSYGSIEGKDLNVQLDDFNSTHSHSFDEVITLDQVHPSSDVTFLYVFSKSEDPYAVLSKAMANGYSDLNASMFRKVTEQGDQPGSKWHCDAETPSFDPQYRSYDDQPLPGDDSKEH